MLPCTTICILPIELYINCFSKANLTMLYIRSELDAVTQLNVGFWLTNSVRLNILVDKIIDET